MTKTSEVCDKPWNSFPSSLTQKVLQGENVLRSNSKETKNIFSKKMFQACHIIKRKLGTVESPARGRGLGECAP